MQQSLVDVAAERCVLAGIMQHGKDAQIDVNDILTTNTFTCNSNQILFKVFEHVLQNNEKIDIPSIVASATTMGVYDIIAKQKKDLEYLRSLTTLPIHLENVRSYAKVIAKLEFTRKIKAKLQTVYGELDRITGNESINSIISIPENAIFELMGELNNDEERKPMQMAEGGEALIQHVIDNPSETIGIPTPFEVFNGAIGGGMRRGGVTLIGGYAKSGKSSIGKETSLHVSDKLDIPTLIIDTEMQKTAVFWRTIASMTGIPINDLERGKFGMFHEKVGKVKAANARLKELRMQHIHVSGMEFEEVLSIIRRWILKEVGFDEGGKTKDCLVIYDYFKLMSVDSLQSLKEYEALGFQISRLSDFCNEYDFPCLSFVQLNREMDVAQSDRLKWLATSYSSYTAKTAEEIANDGPEAGNRKLKVELCRFGPALDPGDYIHMNLRGEICKLHELGTKKDGLKRSKPDTNRLEIQP